MKTIPARCRPFDSQKNRNSVAGERISAKVQRCEAQGTLTANRIPVRSVAVPVGYVRTETSGRGGRQVKTTYSATALNERPRNRPCVGLQAAWEPSWGENSS